jgi:hypothetical protein
MIFKHNQHHAVFFVDKPIHTWTAILVRLTEETPPSKVESPASWVSKGAQETRMNIYSDHYSKVKVISSSVLHWDQHYDSLI